MFTVLLCTKVVSTLFLMPSIPRPIERTIAKKFYFFPLYNRKGVSFILEDISNLIPTSTFLNQVEKLRNEDRDLAHFFEHGAIVKMASQI